MLYIYIVHTHRKTCVKLLCQPAKRAGHSLIFLNESRSWNARALQHRGRRDEASVMDPVFDDDEDYYVGTPVLESDDEAATTTADMPDAAMDVLADVTHESDADGASALMDQVQSLLDKFISDPNDAAVASDALIKVNVDASRNKFKILICIHAHTRADTGWMIRTYGGRYICGVCVIVGGCTASIYPCS